MRVSILPTVAFAGLLTGLVAACAGGSPPMPSAMPSPAVAYEPAPGAPAPEPRSGGGAAQLSIPFNDSWVAGASVEQAKQQKAPAKPVGKPTGKPTPATPTGTTPPAPTDPATQAPAPRRESRLIYTATLVLSVPQIDGALTHVEALATSMGGYLASRNDASIVIRVPRAKFQDTLAEVSKLGDVQHKNVQAEDVSDQVVDLEVRLKNARAVRDRLAQLLQGATATKDALEIEKELARVTVDIESMEGKLQLFADRIAYSTVTVSFQATSTVEVRSRTRLPFPWLDQLGLSTLMEVK